MEEQETKTPIPSSRKRQLEPIDPEQEREDERDSDCSPPSPKVPAPNNFLDEIELHFQRSLANMKSSQGSPVPTTTATDRSHTHSIAFDQQSRDSPSPNQQSRLTPPTSSTSSSSLTSSPRRHGVHNNKPLPPPLKLVSPTSESQSTVQSLYTHQPHYHAPTIRPSSVTQHQAVILPTVTTASGLTGLTRRSPPSSVKGPPALTIPNGLPSGGASPPSVISYSSGGVAQIHALPTISTAALGSGGTGVYIASPQFLSSQQALHQALSNGGSSSPKQSLTPAAISGTSTGGTGGAAATTIPVANNTCGALAAVQLTPGGPLLALPSSVLQPSSAAGNSGHSRTRGRTLLTGLNLSSNSTTGSVGTAGTGTTVASGGSYQIHAPSVTQPGSVHIIDLPIENSAGKSSPPTPYVATAPTLPKAPTVVNVSQIPNLIAINPSSPNSPSPAGSNKSTPTVKVVGTGSSLLTAGTQSPIRVSSAQTTPVATPTLITPQQLAANPSLMSVIDPTASAQLLAAGNTGCSPVYLIPANSMPMVQQPFLIINPSTSNATDLTSIQQLQQANILASNPSLAGASLVSNPTAGGGYLLVSPGSAGTATNFSMPLVNLASTSSVNSSQPAIPNLIPTSPAVTAMTLKPANKAAVLYSTTASSSVAATSGSASGRPTAAKPPLKNQSSTDSVPSPAHSDVMMTPASVDDHFAQALGPQWNKLKSHSNMQPQQC